MGVNSLHKTVTRQRRDCDLNPGPFVSKSSTLTTESEHLEFNPAHSQRPCWNGHGGRLDWIGD